jgi:hypothetical protein
MLNARNNETDWDLVNGRKKHASVSREPVFAVYSNRKLLPLRLKVFLEALAAWKSPLWLRE